MRYVLYYVGLLQTITIYEKSFVGVWDIYNLDIYILIRTEDFGLRINLYLLSIYFANELSTIFAGNADTDGARGETDENPCKKKLHVSKKCLLPIFLRVTTSLDKAIIRLSPGGSSGCDEGKPPEGVLVISARSTTQSLAAAPVCQAAREE